MEDDQDNIILFWEREPHDRGTKGVACTVTSNTLALWTALLAIGVSCLGVKGAAVDRENGSSGDPVLNVAAITLDYAEDPNVNRQRMVEWTRRVVEQVPETRLIAFGETALGWYWHGEARGVPFDEIVRQSTEYHHRIAETVPGPTSEALAAVAQELGVYISFGLTERKGDQIYNSQALLSPKGEVVDVWRKTRLAAPMFSAGSDPIRVHEIDGARVVTLICSDAQSLSLLFDIRRLRPDLVIHSLCDPKRTTEYTQMFSALFRSYLVAPNRVGGEPEPADRYPGRTCICDPLGRIVTASIGEESVLACSIPIRSQRSLARQVFDRLSSNLALGWRILVTSAMHIRQGLEKLLARP